jgi:hypothetical protein
MADTIEEMSVDMTVEDGETLVRVSGTRDMAVIVRSPSGEEVYLPPEEFDDDPGSSPSPDSHYEGESPDQSPYEGAAPDDSPYSAAEGNGTPGRRDAEGRDAGPRPVGVETTASGFRVYHPEPVTDLRIVTE